MITGLAPFCLPPFTPSCPWTSVPPTPFHFPLGCGSQDLPPRRADSQSLATCSITPLVFLGPDREQPCSLTCPYSPPLSLSAEPCSLRPFALFTHHSWLRVPGQASCLPGGGLAFPKRPKDVRASLKLLFLWTESS